MTETAWRGVLILSLAGWGSTVGLVLWLSEMEVQWTLAFMVSVPFIILVRLSWRRLRSEGGSTERDS